MPSVEYGPTVLVYSEETQEHATPRQLATVALSMPRHTNGAHR